MASGPAAIFCVASSSSTLESRLVPRAVRRLHGDGRWRGDLFLPYAGGGPAALEYHHSRRARHRTESKSNATRLIEEQAAQCGNCTAGMIMRAQAQLERMLVTDGSPDGCCRRR